MFPQPTRRAQTRGAPREKGGLSTRSEVLESNRVRPSRLARHEAAVEFNAYPGVLNP